MQQEYKNILAPVTMMNNRIDWLGKDFRIRKTDTNKTWKSH